MGKDPDVLGSEVEQSRSNSRLRKLVLGSAAHGGPVAEETKVHTAIVALVMVRCVDDVLTVVVGVGEILEGDPAVLGLSESTGGRPLRLGRNVAGLSRDGTKEHGSRHQAGLSNGELHVEGVVEKVVSEWKVGGWRMGIVQQCRWILFFISFHARVRTGEYVLPSLLSIIRFLCRFQAE